jgi:hypothetical protein
VSERTTARATTTESTDPPALRSAHIRVGPARSALEHAAEAIDPTAEGSLRWNDEQLWIDRPSQAEPAASERFARSSIVRGWFVPAFTERALGLALAGEERPVVTTANLAPWLVLETGDGRRISLTTTERDRAYALLDALSIGPSTTDATFELFGLAPSANADTSAEPAVWLRSREGFVRASSGAAIPVAIVEAALLYSQAFVMMVVVAALVGASGFAALRAFRRRVTTLRVLREARRASIERVDERSVALDLRKIEGARLSRTGFTVEYADAPRPIAVAVLTSRDGALAIEGEPQRLDTLRRAHAFIDWAQRAGETFAPR